MPFQWLRQFRWLDWLAAAFLFILIREWLLPLPSLTDTSQLDTFYLVIGGVLLLDLCLRSRWLGTLIKAAGVLYLVHDHFFTTSLFGKEWLIKLGLLLQKDIPLVFAQDWGGMSPVSRNMLFYVLLAVIVSLLSHLVIRQRQALWFVVMTETYLATLDTFLPYEADGAIIRALVAGFLLLAVTHFSTMQQIAPSKGNTQWNYWKTLIAPVLIISLTVGIAYAGPKRAPAWPDPIAYLTGNGSGAGTAVVKKVGYDNSDELLGGPFVQDNGLVFTAITNEKTYWRADSKDIYTGEGWEKGDRTYENILQPDQYKWKETLYKGFETKKVEAALHFTNETRYPTIFYPGQLTGLKNYRPNNATLVYDTENEQVEVRAGQIKIVTSKEAQPIDSVSHQFVPNSILMKMNQYELTAEVPIVSEKKVTTAGTDYPKDITDRYLQLPPGLPARVKQLAEKVTANATNPYEKARAVESFLRTGGEYAYETTDVPVLLKGQDFVDQFLFESKRGYCDHFSSSMAVMLRSVGVPTRWVKGFAPGKEVELQGDKRVIEVQNKDAHSWVEVYFPSHGWIPFEATSSFVSPLRIDYDLNRETNPQPVIPGVGNTKPREMNPDRLGELDETGGSGSGGIRISGKWVTGILIVLAVAAYFLWRHRERIRIWVLHRKMTAYPTHRFTDRYQALLMLVEALFSRRRTGETLREYVSRLDVSGDKRQDLLYLTQLFERMLYGFKELEEKGRETADKIMERLTRQLKP